MKKDDNGLKLSRELYEKGIDLEDAIFNPDLFSSEDVVRLAEEVKEITDKIIELYSLNR